jgi:hypothetical protein
MASIYNFFGDIWDYLRETYWEVDLGTYDNFSLGSLGAMLPQIVLAIMPGIILASAAMLYERQYIGGFIRKLLSADAKSEEKALLLTDTGYGKSLIIKRMLRHRDTAVRKLVRFTGEEREEPTPLADGRQRLQMKDDINFAEARFYIPEELAARAAVRYDPKGNNWRTFILTVLVSLIGAALLLRILPVFFNFIDSVIGWLA